jgi:hypothetical protein
MEADVAAALATLTADLAALRAAVVALGEGQQDAVAGLALLDKGAAVSEAKADIRARDLEAVRTAVDKITGELVPVVAYFDAQNKAVNLAQANRLNLWSYVTPARVTTVIGIVTTILALYFPLPHARPVQSDEEPATVDE